MSYKTPISTITGLKGIDKKIQDIASHMKDLTWLSYAFGLANRDVSFKDGKENIIPTAYQDLNSKDPISMIPSDLYKAFSFWIKDPETTFDENNIRLKYKVSCIFYCDLEQIAPTFNYAVTKSKIRQDILRFFRTHENSGFGQLDITSIIDDDITQVYKGFSLSQIDNKYRMLPKYAIRLNFDYSFLAECEGYSVFNMKYGLLYNYYAAVDARNIANTGWHVPSDDEYYTLLLYADPVTEDRIHNVAAAKLKTSGFDYFQYPNIGANNILEFNSVGSGMRLFTTGLFKDIKLATYLMTSTIYNSISSYVVLLNNITTIFYNHVIFAFSSGSSIRLIKDSTTLKHGEKGIYIGNNGKIYNTICIGTQEWLSENLAETKYRDGSAIPEVTDNAAWVALTTGALCAYNNDWNNAI